MVRDPWCIGEVGGGPEEGGAGCRDRHEALAGKGAERLLAGDLLEGRWERRRTSSRSSEEHKAVR